MTDQAMYDTEDLVMVRLECLRLALGLAQGDSGVAKDIGAVVAAATAFEDYLLREPDMGEEEVPPAVAAE